MREKKSKKRKPLKMQFFHLPTLVLQSKKVENTQSGVYTCLTRTRSCSLNLKLDLSSKRYQYRWYFSGQIIESANPRALSFPVGTHTGRVEVFYSGSRDPIWSESFSFLIEKTPPKKRSEKITPSAKQVESPDQNKQKNTDFFS